MSIPKITQENVHIFIPLKVAKVTEMISKKYDIPWQQALLDFYNSKVYSILEKEDTKLWYEGTNYLFMAYEMERKGEKLDI
ncbi:hypothetical protein [Clostridium cochlearium]|uniref:hypothetical protein n=1 Tax=Clostridium cochlearium TaxID=1494 RepID=UPI0015711A3F|nr:hypothetical protein [Clostridium cochlearium]MCG4581158.1 hypothetical protein [Clostridium cochlearium]MCR1972362.1 hypothetical protein [Clostridium cochlearium]NSJ92098.1 hypothetical protein [Coprococcus sp. MSK.21.13]